jgi:DNA-3-methyladenine glycosylase I
MVTDGRCRAGMVPEGRGAVPGSRRILTSVVMSVATIATMPTRCAWVPPNDELYVTYHDLEWGAPLHDERRLFELLCLEGAQAGLSWRTILARRDGYRAVFDRFDPDVLAAWDDGRVEAALLDARIVRNRLKVNAVRENARAVVALHAAGTTLDRFLWDFVGSEPVQNRWETLAETPVSTPEAETMSRTLKRLGFRFVGPTICYAFMEAAGLVNDHTADCFRYDEVRSGA